MQPRDPFGYQSLPADLYSEVKPHIFPAPELFTLNAEHANALDLDVDWLASEDGLSFLSGGSAPALAMAYAGHQFGHWSGALGDGRARLIADALAKDGLRRELHLKGAGRTPYSRGGDGKATLGSAIREYIVSEAMAALGVPTTRALSVVVTGQQIAREGMEPGAVLCRTARSHVRVGTFQYAAALKTESGQTHVKALADFTLDRLYQDAPKSGPKRYEYLIKSAAARKAELIAKWMSFGFIHGVMNTDNACLSGETIDYGPCAFMDEFHPAKTFSSIDRRGRYAWNRQPEIAHWNMARLAETLLPLLSDDEAAQQASAEAALNSFAPGFQTAFNTAFARKLGINPMDEKSAGFISDTLKAMTEAKLDFTVFFTALTRLAGGEPDSIITVQFDDKNAGQAWLENWKVMSGFANGMSQETLDEMARANPVIIARNHQVETAINQANGGNRAHFDRLLDAVQNPFSQDEKYAEFQIPPTPEEVVTKTFCGT